MSRSNPTLTNPAEHFFEWAGSKGVLQWYDKENKRNVQVKLPFEFWVLDELSTITGYSKQNESGFWANEVRNVSKDELFVRIKKGPFEAGLYANLVQTRAKGGKYAKSIYLAHKIGDDWVIGNFKASGSALSAWIEFSKTLQRGALDVGKVTMTRGDQQDAPTGPFYAPVFEYAKATDEENVKTGELDRELQIYLNQYLSQPKGDEALDGALDDDADKATPDQAGDYEDMRAKAKKPQPAGDDGDPGFVPDEVIEDIGDEPINLDDIPF
jgi:hypothetical protein